MKKALFCVSSIALAHVGYTQLFNQAGLRQRPLKNPLNDGRDTFLDELVMELTVPELVLQMHLMFADNIIGPNGDHGSYDRMMQPAPSAAIGMIHDWYPTNTSQYNELQRLNALKARVNIPILQTGECLHGVGSFTLSMFPQAIGLAASFDTGLVHRVGRAIGVEASSIGVRACFSPVLDLGKDPRWGRVQEAWGEDVVLTSHMGVAYASGLSKNSSWSDPDAVVPVMKHFAAHGSPQGGHNGAPFFGYGHRSVLHEMLVPFKAAIDLGGVKGVMMAYNDLDEVPCSVNPLLYKALDEWGFDGYITADDAGLLQLFNRHRVTSSVADTIAQWQNAGGMVQFYDFPLDQYVETFVDLVANSTVSIETLRSHVRRILGVKYDLGLFHNRYITAEVHPESITTAHQPLTLEAAHKTIVLLENRNKLLPLDPGRQGLQRIALVGPFSDTFNHGDYSDQWGSAQTLHASTLRQGIMDHLEKHSPATELITSWGANSWMYNAQYTIPPYLLTAQGQSGGLWATYYADSHFQDARFETLETPSRNWGIYPPRDLPSNNFSVVWEGTLSVPVDTEVEGWLGVAVNRNNCARLYVDGVLLVEVRADNVLSNIPGRSYSETNGTSPPPGSGPFTFRRGAQHTLRLEYQAWKYTGLVENMGSLNSQVLLFWNLVDRHNPMKQAVELARSSDVVVLAVGAAWNSDGEGGDRANLGLSPDQAALADAIFALDKPVVMVLQGGRPFAIPEYYSKAAAVLNTFFPGQSGGQAISDALFGVINPGGRVPLSVPSSVGTLPVFYNYKQTAERDYTDLSFQPVYPFGYGLSYTTFETGKFRATQSQFTPESTVTFRVDITNTGEVAGSYVAQIYLLGRVSSITRPVRQLVAFSRVYLDAGVSYTATLEVEVSRYLAIVDRWDRWTVERGEYTFALLENGGMSVGPNVTLTCI